MVLCGVIVTLIAAAVTVARAAETVKPLSLSESIDLALKRSVLIHAAREGVRGAEAQRKECAFTGFSRNSAQLHSYNRLQTRNRPLIFPVLRRGSRRAPYQNGGRRRTTWSVEARQPLFAGGVHSRELRGEPHRD